MRVSSALLLCAVGICTLAGGAAAANRAAGSATWVTDSEGVQAVATSGSRVFIGGFFTGMAPRTGALALVVPGDGRTDSRFPEFAGELGQQVGGSVREPAAVDAVIADGSGGWFVGGQFTSVGGAPCPHLAHIRANLTVDRAFCRSPDGVVLALASNGSALFVGGLFTKIGTTPRERIAAFDATSGALLPWNPRIGGPKLFDRFTPVPHSVDALVATPSTVYIGGTFGRVGGKPHRNLAAVDASSGHPLAWTVDVGAPLAAVNALVLLDRRLYVGGFFETVAGVGRRGLAAVDSATGRVESWNPFKGAGPFADWVLALAPARSGLIVGGVFTRIGGSPRRNLALISETTGRPLGWRADTDKAVRAVGVDGDHIYVGGEFTRVAGQTRLQAAELGATDGRVAGWSPAPLGPVEAIVAGSRGVLVGGAFAGMGRREVSHLAALDSHGAPLPQWQVPVDGSVSALAVAAGRLYVGGAFDHVGGRPRAGLAAVDLATGRVVPWAPRLGAHNYGVETIAVSGGVVYVGGDFASIGGVKQSALAAVDAATGRVEEWHPSVGSSTTDDGSATVAAIDVVNGTVYVGGDFDLVAGKPHAPVAAFDRGGRLLDWDPAVATAEAPEVRALTDDGSALYVGGSFSMFDGQKRTNAAAFELATGRLTQWTPRAAGEIGDGVAAIAVEAGIAYLGGTFHSVDGRPRDGLAAVDAGTGALRTWAADAPGVAAIATSSHRVYVGGTFTHVGDVAQSGIAVLLR
jgi:outer membrane protein assembly factor BamB